MKPALDIIIVNWNSKEQLKDCLQSIVKTRKDSFELLRVVIVDNASIDGSVDNLEKINLPLILIQNKKNRGFSAACNQGTLNSKANYLLFLNPDTRLFENSLNKPITFMENPENKKVGICGIQTVDENNNIHRHCTRFLTPKTILSKIFGLYLLFPKLFPSSFMVEWDHKNSQQVDQVIGAFYLVRKSLFDILEGFDERFFVYGEDMDFAYRSLKSGFISYYLSDAVVFHKGNGTTEQIKAKRLFYSRRSYLQYLYKHYNFTSATLVSICILLVEPINRIILSVFKGSFHQITETLEGYFYLWQYLVKLNGRTNKID